MTGFASGGSGNKDTAEELLASLSTGIFAAANYTTRAASQAASAVAKKSTQAAGMLKERTMTTSSQFANQEFSQTLKSTASSGWGSFSSWVGQAASAATHMVGEAANSLTEAIVRDDDSSGPIKLYNADTSARGQAEKPKYEGFGNQGVLGAGAGDDFFNDANYNSNSGSHSNSRSNSLGRSSNASSGSRNSSSMAASRKDSQSQVRDTGLSSQSSGSAQRDSRFTGFGNDGSSQKSKQNAIKKSQSDNTIVKSKSGGFAGFGEASEVQNAKTPQPSAGDDDEFDLGELEIDSPPQTKRTVAQKPAKVASKPAAVDQTKIAPAASDGWDDDDFFDDMWEWLPPNFFSCCKAAPQSNIYLSFCRSK